MFTFRVHPAAVSVTDGMGHAFEYLGSTWRSWLPVVLALAVLDFVAFLVIFSIAGDGLYYIDRWSDRVELAPDAGAKLLQMVPAFILYLGASVAAQWAFTGIAIAGLRGWKLTASVVLSRGLVSLASWILVAAICLGVGLVWIVVTVAAPGIGILALFVLIPVSVYAWIRITFVTLAVFDGFGPLGGLQESWRLSQGAVLRMFGWALMAGFISAGITAVAGQGGVLIPSSDTGGLALAQGVSGGVSAVVSVFSTLFMAVLYESQRARHDPSLYPMPGYPYPTPVAAYPGAVPPGWYPPPYPYAQPYAQPGGPAWGDGQTQGPAPEAPPDGQTPGQ